MHLIKDWERESSLDFNDSLLGHETESEPGLTALLFS